MEEHVISFQFLCDVSPHILLITTTITRNICNTMCENITKNVKQTVLTSMFGLKRSSNTEMAAAAPDPEIYVFAKCR